MLDIYLYDDAPVLRNKLEIKDEKVLDLIEAEQSRAGMMLLYEAGFHDFSPAGLCAIHQKLFGDLYEWAGHYRVINIEKHEKLLVGKSVWYSNAENIEDDLKRAFKQIATKKWEEMSKEQFVQTLARCFPKLWQVHPFREGNTRTVVMMMTFQPPETAPSSGTAASTSYGAVPFELAAGTDKWWKIDSTDTAYWAVQENINAMRAAGGLPALTMDDALSTTASSRCESFVAGGPFDHSGMVTRSEICASGPLFSAADVCTAWQNSETHYANIMRSDISRMGVGCWFCEADGSKYTYWTVTFE